MPALPPSRRAGEVSRKPRDCLTSSSVLLNVLSSSREAMGAKSVVPMGSVPQVRSHQSAPSASHLPLGKGSLRARGIALPPIFPPACSTSSPALGVRSHSSILGISQCSPLCRVRSSDPAGGSGSDADSAAPQLPEERATRA